MVVNTIPKSSINFTGNIRIELKTETIQGILNTRYSEESEVSIVAILSSLHAHSLSVGI